MCGLSLTGLCCCGHAGIGYRRFVHGVPREAVWNGVDACPRRVMTNIIVEVGGDHDAVGSLRPGFQSGCELPGHLPPVSVRRDRSVTKRSHRRRLHLGRDGAHCSRTPIAWVLCAYPGCAKGGDAHAQAGWMELIDFYCASSRDSVVGRDRACQCYPEVRSGRDRRETHFALPRRTGAWCLSVLQKEAIRTVGSG